MTRTIFFDMDGTIADLYGVPSWRESLENNDPSPYANARPLVNLCQLARRLNTLARQGWRLAIISWTSKNSSDEYAAAVSATKLKWLSVHLKSVNWTKINIIPYGTDKALFMTSEINILFDDEDKNRINWEEKGGIAYNETEILEKLRELTKES